MKVFGKLILVGAAGFVLVQFVRPSIPFRPASAEVQAPPQVKQVLEKDCYSCHSDERRLAWFDRFAPGYWLVRYDVLTARDHLNFSTLGSKPAAVQKVLRSNELQMWFVIEHLVNVPLVNAESDGRKPRTLA